MSYSMNNREMETSLLTFLMHSIDQGIAVVDHNLHVSFLNQAMSSLLDLPSSVLEQNASLDHVYRYLANRGDFGACDTESLVAERVAIVRNRLEHNFERERPDGRIVHVQGTPLDNGSYAIVLSDVTEQRNYEAKLESIQYELELKLENSLAEVRYNRDLLIQAIDAVDDGLVILDENHQLVLANQRIQTLYPVLRRHLAQHSHICRVEGFDLPCAENPDDPQNNKLCSAERKLHDGHWYRIEQSAIETGGRIAIFSDITTYKEQTSKLQDHTNSLVKLLQKEITLSETQREFVSMASHEFKTPLAIIDSNAQRIQRKIDRNEGSSLEKERITARLGNIREAVSRMQFLINRFLDFSSEEIAGFKMEAKQNNLRASLEKLCIFYMEMNEGTQISWNLDALPDQALFDRNLLDQCVSNILSNAIKYSPAHTPINVIARRDERYIKIEIHDRGVGIPKDELPKIFRKYYRASTSSGIAGTGIGLNFAQLALKEHGGRIEVQSVVGEGSCFTILLPLNVSCDDAQEPSNTPGTGSEQAKDKARIAS